MRDESEDDDEVDETLNSYRTAHSFHEMDDTQASNRESAQERGSPQRRTSQNSVTESERTIRLRRRPSSTSTTSSRSKSSYHESVNGSAILQRPAQLKRRPTGRTSRMPSMQGHAHSNRVFSADDTEMEIQRDADAVLSRTISDYAQQRPHDRRHLSSAGKSKLGEQALREIEEHDGLGDNVSEGQGDLELDDDEDSDSIHSDASDESFTLKERQDAINKSHPFGIKIWKPAIYKKKRSVQKAADGEIHSTPGRQNFDRFSVGNVLWAILFGWWLGLLIMIVSVACHLLSWRSGARYGRLCFGLARYLVYPFGQYVELKKSERYAEEDEGLGDDLRDFDDIEQFGATTGSGPSSRGIIGRSASSASFQNGEEEPLLGFVGGRTNTQAINPKRRAFGRGQWSFGRIVFFMFFYVLVAPCMLIVSGLCWLTVFPLPMAKICFALIHHLRSHPLALTFHWDIKASLRPGSPDRKVVLCTYRAMGWQYYKYTVDGTVSVKVQLRPIISMLTILEHLLHQSLGSRLFHDIGRICVDIIARTRDMDHFPGIDLPLVPLVHYTLGLLHWPSSG